MKKYKTITIGKIFDFILSLIFPERCVVCDGIIDYGEGICKNCSGKLLKIDNNRCYKCGKQLNNYQAEYCDDCRKCNHKFNRGYPLYVYDDNIKKSIYRFKYANRQRYAKYYGKEIVKEFGDIIKNINPDVILPVPLHKSRYRKRGYNQAELIANEIGELLNIPVNSEWVIRLKNTTPLKMLNPEQRQNNLKKAFKIVDNDVKLSTVLIVDDIYTTGSTIDEISEVLLAAGIKEINFIALSSGSNI